MKKIKFLYVSLICTLGLISCSENPFDSTTDLGSDIVDQFDPTITDFDRNFKSVQLNLAVEAGNTVAQTRGGLAPGLHGGAYVGEWAGQNEKAVTYLEFDGAEIKKLVDSLSQDSLQMKVDFQGALQQVQLYLLPDTLLTDFSFSDIPLDQALGTYTAEASDSSATFQLGMPADSLINTLLDTVYTTYFDSTDTNDIKTIKDTSFNDIGFVLASDGPVAELQRVGDGLARLVFTTMTPDSTFETQTVTPEKVVTSVFVLEPYAQTVSSLASSRVAVFPVDLTALWDELENDTSDLVYQSVLSAELTINIDTLFDRYPGDSAVTIKYALEGTEITEENDLTSLGDFRVTLDSSAYTIRIEQALNRFLMGEQQSQQIPRPETAYLYLPVTSYSNELFSKVIWESQETFSLRAVLTTPR